jgi:cytochrome c peroxidase
MKKLITPLLLSTILFSCGGETEEQKLEKLAQQENERYDLSLKDKMSIFSALPSKAENPDNVATTEKIKLGHVLYFDKRLSLNNTISCNSCHNLSTFGVDNLPTSPGDAGENGGRNSPTVLNAALHTTQFWDGRAKDVEEQAGMPITNPIEMAIPSKEFLVKRLKEIELYQDLFKQAYPNEADPLTYSNIEKSIAAFERQLLTPSRFDDYLNGNKSALTVQEKKGMLSFINIGCTSCHSGSLLGGNSFQKFGVYKNYWELTGSEKIDEGRYEVTKQEFDKYMFKVPSLRNIAQTGPYLHDGSVSDLKKVVEIMADAQLKYNINNSEVENIVAFLNALTGSVPEEFKNEPAVLKN